MFNWFKKPRDTQAPKQFDADNLISKITSVYEEHLSLLTEQVANENKHKYATVQDVHIALVRSDADKAWKEYTNDP
jgi:hypothetical protein